MSVRALLLVVAATVLGAVAAGCGGGDGETTTTTAATVQVFFPRGDPGPDCDTVVGVDRTVGAPYTLRGALEALLEGPTAAERQTGYDGWFSAETAGMVRSVRIEDGVAHVDFDDFRNKIPNASASCGSALLLAQLGRTVTQFPSVDRAVYSFDGDADAFYEWLQREAP